MKFRGSPEGPHRQLSRLSQRARQAYAVCHKGAEGYRHAQRIQIENYGRVMRRFLRNGFRRRCLRGAGHHSERASHPDAVGH